MPSRFLSSPVRVTFVGERPAGSAPSWTLARALERRGVECRFSQGLENTGTRDWLRLAAGSTGIVLVHYGGPAGYLLRQLASAAALGTPVVRWWVGTDVLRVLQDADTRRSALEMQRILSGQLAVSPHLVEELASVGLHADYLPSVLDPGPPPAVLADVPKALLVYFPTDKSEVYDGSRTRAAIEAFPQVRFVVVGDRSGSLAGYANVDDLGWVGDMDPVWQRVGGLMRLTAHDGMPRMVLEALRRGKHVIYSWPFPACILCRTDEDVRAGIATFLRTDAVNAEGIAEAERVLRADPARQFEELLVALATGSHWQRRLSAAAVTAKQTLRLKAGLWLMAGAPRQDSATTASTTVATSSQN